MENTKFIFDKLKKHLEPVVKRSSASLADTLDKTVSPKTQSSPVSYRFTDREPNTVKFGPEMLLEVSKKLLDLNRGLTTPDNRDALYFRRAYTPPDLLRERIALDADRTMRNVIKKATYRKNLKSLNSGAFSGYVDGLIIGNPLSMPLEQMNPMQMLEQSRRFTQMGPGGIASAESIVESAQNVDPSEFYFIDTIAGPESEKIGIDTRASWGTKIGDDGKLYQRFYDRKQDAYVWLNPQQASTRVISFPD